MDFACASCNRTMQSVLYRGVNARFCLSCKSLFLGPGQLESILASEEGTGTTDSPDSHRWGQNRIQYCPSCDGAMEKHDYGKILKTAVLRCTGCNGLWLHMDDLKRLEHDYGIVRENTDSNRGRRITCPRCGHVQDRSDQCARCGVYFEKLRSPRTAAGGDHPDRTLLEHIAYLLIEKLKYFQKTGNRHVLAARHFLDSLQDNRITSLLMTAAGWLLILVNVYLAWLILQYLFTHITTPPPRPKDFYSDLSNVSIFYIFAVVLAGPIVLAITYVLWRLFWYSLYGPILGLTHRYFHPLVKPVIAAGLMLLVLQSAELFTRGFWTGWWWVGQQYSQARSHKLQR